MGTTLRFFLTIFFGALFMGLYGQRKHDLHFGCHMTDEPVKLSPASLTDFNLTCGSNTRSDSIDVLKYDIDIDLTNFGNSIIASCKVTFTAKEDGIEGLPLDLLELNVDSVLWNGTQLNFDYDDLLLHIALPAPVNIGDTAAVVVYYQGLPKPDPAWGGFRYESGIGYNLGIGLTSNPYSMGRSWHPCFDNFVERATYDISVTTNNDRTGYAIGELLQEEDLGNGVLKRSYRMDLPLPTYLVGVAASEYIEVNDMHSGIYGDYPILLVGRIGDGPDMIESFEYLGNAIDALEAWFGPYQWGQVGYVMTPRGAMEHASLIAFPFNSLGSGPTFGTNRLMAHELAHHWWGNVTTLSCPDNMWIKEGNAEYGAHLFQEFTFGKEFFIEVVKDNFFDVMNSAHQDDNGYHPLSGIPYENTYGTHTYNKGASMMHNLRGYLGDTLFQKGMSSVLVDHQFSAVDAQEMQDQLTAETGIDMSHFFNAWIYQPGFATYELDSVHYEPNGNEWNATLFVQQKLREAFSFHTNTPIEITFLDENWNEFHQTAMVSGEFTEVTVSVPFEPVWQIMNDRHHLNIGRWQDRLVVKEEGNMDLDRVGAVLITADEFPEGDSAMVSLIHHWAGADPDPNQPDLQVSSTHYWTYGGVFPEGFKTKTTLQYRGNSDDDFDYDLLANLPEDSIKLVWRPDAATPWGEYPFYSQQTLGSSTDGTGFIRVNPMLAGDYAFAIGESPLATSVSGQVQDIAVKVYPNPVSNTLNVQAVLPESMNLDLSIFDATGKLVSSSSVRAWGGELVETLDVQALPAGMYWLEMSSEDGAYTTLKKFVKN